MRPAPVAAWRHCGVALWLTACLGAVGVASCSRDSPEPSTPVEESPLAERFNGTWVREGAELGLWAVDDERLQVSFRGEHTYFSDAGPMVNVGEADGWARVNGDTAVFRPIGREVDCAITMRASTGSLDVREQGDCGFGLNVTAAGTYRRISRERPALAPRVPPAALTAGQQASRPEHHSMAAARRAQ